MDELKGLPHCWRNRFRCKSTAVDDLENLVVQIVKFVLKSDFDNWHQNGFHVKQDIWRALQRQDQGANCLQDTQRGDALIV